MRCFRLWTAILPKRSDRLTPVGQSNFLTSHDYHKTSMSSKQDYTCVVGRCSFVQSKRTCHGRWTLFKSSLSWLSYREWLRCLVFGFESVNAYDTAKAACCCDLDVECVASTLSWLVFIVVWYVLNTEAPITGGMTVRLAVIIFVKALHTMDQLCVDDAYETFPGFRSMQTFSSYIFYNL